MGYLAGSGNQNEYMIRWDLDGSVFGMAIGVDGGLDSFFCFLLLLLLLLLPCCFYYLFITF